MHPQGSRSIQPIWSASDRLVILGASVRSAVESAARTGISVVAADLFQDRDVHPCAESVRVTRYPDQFAEIAEAIPPGYWMYTGGLENEPELVDAISRRHHLLGNAGTVLRHVRDPWQLGRAVRRAGLAFPRPRHTPPPSGSGEWVEKPLHSCGGLGMRQVITGDSAAVASPAHWSPRPSDGAAGRVYYQPFVSGASVSAVYAAARGRATCLGVTRQLLRGARESGRSFRYAGSIGPLRLSQALKRTFDRLGDCLAHAFALNGVFGVDVVVSGEDVWILEVNPRFTASMEILERGGWTSIVGLHCAACRRGELPADKPACGPLRHGKAIVFAERAVTIDRRFSEWLDTFRSLPWSQVGDLPQIGSRIARGDPVLTVFVAGASGRVVAEQLRARVREVRRRLSDTAEGAERSVDGDHRS